MPKEILRTPRIQTITVCKAYRTTDGSIHNTKEEALKWEFKIAVQSIFNRNGTRTQSAFTPKEVADIVLKNLEEVKVLLRSVSWLPKKEKEITYQ